MIKTTCGFFEWPAQRWATVTVRQAEPWWLGVKPEIHSSKHLWAVQFSGDRMVSLWDHVPSARKKSLNMLRTLEIPPKGIKFSHIIFHFFVASSNSAFNFVRQLLIVCTGKNLFSFHFAGPLGSNCELFCRHKWDDTNLRGASKKSYRKTRKHQGEKHNAFSKLRQTQSKHVCFYNLFQAQQKHRMVLDQVGTGRGQGAEWIDPHSGDPYWILALGRSCGENCRPFSCFWMSRYFFSKTVDFTGHGDSLIFQQEGIGLLL